MNELTSCNFCSLRQIRNRAQVAGKKVHIVYDNGSARVYVYPKEVKLPFWVDESTEFHEKYFTAWFMELSDHCCC